MSDRIPQDVLESYLWGSAKLLRTNIDAGSYKQYIFPLLFFKRLCDVYDEKKAADRAKYGDDAELYADDYLFKIPKGAHWRDILETTEDVGEALVKAFKAIENENPEQLTGIFGDAAWTNKNRLPDRLLKDLIAHFGTQTLSLERCPEDELGKGYEYLIKKFADDSGHTAQEFYTNRTVVALMTEMLRPKSNESIYDPTCGSGGMLISAIKWLKDRGEEYRNVRVYGQEINAITSSIARMNLFLHGIADFHIVNADTLKYPAFCKAGALQTFDMVLANPPYSISQWDRTAFEDDKWGRNFLGTPPQSRADYAFIQHILKSLDAKSGRCAILLPHGVLFRDEERTIREALVKSDLVEAVIGLGANLFFNSPMESCIVICRTMKPVERKGKILFINAKAEVERKNSESYLTAEHIAKIAAAYHEGADVPGFAMMVERSEIEQKGWSLNIALYVGETSQRREAEEQSFEELWAEYLAKAAEAADDVSRVEHGEQGEGLTTDYTDCGNACGANAKERKEVVGSAPRADRVGTVGSAPRADRVGTVGSCVSRDRVGTVGSAPRADRVGTVGSRVPRDRVGLVGAAPRAARVGTVGSRVPRDRVGTVGAAPRAARQTVTFGEIAFNSVAKKKPAPDDVSHYIGLEHLDPENFEVTRWGSDVAPVGEKLLMKKGDLLFGKRRAYQRKVAIAPFDGIFSAHGMVLRPNEKVIDKDFFPFFIASDAFLSEAIRISVGGLSPTINWKDLKVLQFSLPPLAEQKKLASALWAMERVKRAYKKLLAETDRLVEARFVEMFGDGKCPLVPLSELTTKITDGTHKTPRYLDSGVVFISAKNVVSGVIDFADIKYISEEEYTEIQSRCGLEKGDVLLTKSGSLGMPAIVTTSEKIGLFESLAVIKYKRDILCADYVKAAIESASVQLQLMANVKGVAVKHLHLNVIGKTKIPLPPLSLQREFAAFVGRAEKAKASLKNALASLTAAQKAKMNGAFRG